MAEQLPRYIISVDDTMSGKSFQYGSDTLADAERHALKMMRRFPAANAVVKTSRDDQVVAYFES